MQINLNIVLLAIIIVALFVLIKKTNQKPKVKKVITYEEQHPSYRPFYTPFHGYDIREMLPPSRRTYMRYPYYATRYGIFVR